MPGNNKTGRENPTQMTLTPEVLRNQRSNLKKVEPPQQRVHTHNAMNQTYINAKSQLKPTTPVPKQDFSVNQRTPLLDSIRQAKTGLKPPVKEQRYIVSPHKSVSNLMNNSLGMGKHALSEGHNMVRPVFKDEAQREAFHQSSQSKLSGLTSGSSDHTVMSQLSEWSKPGSAMMNFDNVSTKRSHPIVYTQGHGSPGVKSISSDDHSEAPVTGQQMATQLTKMNLPKVSEVRANSCFSGTQNWVPNTSTVKKEHQEQVVDINRAGSWDQTFAGDMQQGLDKRDGSHNRVRGYMGPTSQSAMSVQKLGIGSMLHKTKSSSMASIFATQQQLQSSQYLALKRSDTKRYGKE